MKHTELLTRIRKNDIKALKALILEYSDNLSILAFSILGDSERANALVLEVLYDLWKYDTLREVNKPLYQFLCEEIRISCALESF